MMKKYDAIIIGSGIIGCNIAFELAKKGWKTINVDKLSAAGSGSTSNSCAVIRVHYSTLDGTAMAYESFFYWNDWSNYLGVDDPIGNAHFFKTGILVFKSPANDYLEKTVRLLDELQIPYENWDVPQIQKRFPIYDKSDLPGFYMAVGTSGNQYKNAPVVGKMMSTLIEECQNGHEHDLNPIQLHLEHLDRKISLGFYSRLREINMESSFSVLG